MPLCLYNTFTKREEQFVPMDPKEVRMYSCGPTVYGRPHIGNLSSFLMADLLRRWLEVSGYRVKHVKNITDVGHLIADRDDGEDKIEKQVREEKKFLKQTSTARDDVMQVVEKYTNQYLEDEKALNMLEPFARPRATEHIAEMLTMIRVLIKEGHAYETGDAYYFAVQTFPKYGALSGNTLENLNAGARVQTREEKHHPADFALWKKCVGSHRRHILRWSFRTGVPLETTGEDATAGFPGWHIECSAMSRKLLGEQIDIHTGGEDNIFPHHECEIAQSECTGPSPFARLWLHKRRIDLGSEKMSKSLGNVLTMPDIVAMGYSPLDLRYSLLSVHYRTHVKFTEKWLRDAKIARRKIMEWVEEMMAPRASNQAQGVSADAVREAWEAPFKHAMNADLNTPEALGCIFDLLHWSRKKEKKEGFQSSGRAELNRAITCMKETFGCFEEESERGIPPDVQELMDERARARAEKKFAESDRLRGEIRSKGYEVRDEGRNQTIKKM